VAARILGAADAQIGDRFTFIPYMSMFVGPAQLDRLLADPQVVSVQEDIPSPPLLAQSGPLVHAPDVWAKGVTGTGRVIAVLDTGVAKTHPMLAGKVVSEACYSTENALYLRQSFCPGRVTATTAAGSGVNCPVSVPGCDHGTHVAGIAAGNGATLDGIATGAKIIAIQVFTRFTNTNPDQPRSFDTDQIKALQRVYALRGTFKIAAVNMSLGAGGYTAECDAQFPALTAAIPSCAMWVSRPSSRPATTATAMQSASRHASPSQYPWATRRRTIGSMGGRIHLFRMEGRITRIRSGCWRPEPTSDRQCPETSTG
jgi:hypothetical protein